MITSRNREEVAAPARSGKATILKQVRQLHLYLGVFFAPAILFFSLTGALQLFGLHEGHPGEPYQPPRWIVALGSIHKKQVLSERRGLPPGPRSMERSPAGPRASKAEPGERKESKATVALKWFFLAMSGGLVLTTLLGIYMAFKYNRSRVTVWGLLIAGTAIPAALIALLT